MLLAIICALVALVIGGVAGFFAGVSHRKKVAEQKIGSAEEEAKRLVNDAMKTAQQKRKEALVEAKDAALQMKTEADKEIKERRNELTRQERRLDQKEESVDRKTAALEQKEEDLRQRTELCEARLSEIEQIDVYKRQDYERVCKFLQKDQPLFSSAGLPGTFAGTGENERYELGAAALATARQYLAASDDLKASAEDSD